MKKTYNLILESREFVTGLFSKAPVAEEGIVIFLSKQERSTPLVTITANHNPKMREIQSKHCGWQTVVDIAPHIVDLEIEAKTKDHISKFIVTLKVDVHVIKPEIIYRDWVKDLAEYVKYELEGLVEKAADERGIQENLLLKEQLNNHLKDGLQLEAIEVRAKNISVGYDQDTEKHLRELLNMERQKEVFMKRREVAGKIGEKLDGDTGALMDIFEGKRSASDIVDVRRQLKKNVLYDTVEEITKEVELLNHLMENGMLSELDGQKAMKELLPKLGGVNQTTLEEKESEIYASSYEEESPE